MTASADKLRVLLINKDGPVDFVNIGSRFPKTKARRRWIAEFAQESGSRPWRASR